jgi:3-phenylpropionate/trans-cinnamate dioxygenase ferredoxin reductase subunit
VLGTRVVSIDRAAKTVTTADGATHGYEQLLIATGGKPRGLPGLEPSDRVLDHRSAADYRRLRTLADAGLTVDDGIVVSSTLVTDDPAVFAAGDVARYPDRILGTRRVEHVDNAQQQGRQAGRNLADADETYDHTPMYYSNVFDMGYEAVGTVSTDLRAVEDWQDPTVTGVVYYLDDDDTVRGVLLWNVADRTDEARKVIAEASALTPDMLPGRITA